MKSRTAVISGVTGQDGSYLAELLLNLGYEVHGLIRRSSSFNTSRIDYLQNSKFSDKFHVHHSDLHEPGGVTDLVSTLRPTELYNLGAQSHVRVSFDLPVLTGQITGLATLSCLEAIRKYSPETKMYQASSSEMFGATPPPQSENSAFAPRSPYGAAKLYSYWMARNYREAYGLFISNGILFNHESPRRTPTFVTRKVTRAVARIKSGLDQSLTLGNLEARRDWGYAPEYVIGMWLLLQKEGPLDLVLGTGTSTSVREWVDKVFELAGLDQEAYLATDDRFLRPTEVENLIADASLAETELDWRSSTSPDRLAEIMLRHDFDSLHNPDLIDHVDSETWTALVGKSREKKLS